MRSAFYAKTQNKEAYARFTKLKNWLERNKNTAPKPSDPHLLALHLCFDECCQFEDNKVHVLVKQAKMTVEEIRWLLKGCKQLKFKAEW